MDYPSTPGTTSEWLYVDNGWRDGIWSFNINTITRPVSGDPTASKTITPDVEWSVTVNTGAIYPRELNAKVKNVTFTQGGSFANGYYFTIKFKPVPIAWRWNDGPYGCDMTACGDNTTIAEFVSPASADGYVSDLDETGTGTTRADTLRNGFILASNAQYHEEPTYDAAADALVVKMANPHLSATGVQAKGFFEAFLPNAYLTAVMGVPDPATLGSSAFTVQRIGATTLTPYTLTRTQDGIWIRVTNIGFSRPQFRVKAKPTVPGKPRLYDVVKLNRTQAKAKFYAPIANGNARIDKYQARCHAPGKVWRYKSGVRSPLTVSSLTRGNVYCQTRAHNVKGWGRWSTAVRS
ncbi:MAG: hypothetical protein EOO67_09225 [Microbacterium sp.]|nr:MAG: hypothetical protein EOO67_09225 [Microbacterium sp.]